MYVYTYIRVSSAAGCLEKMRILIADSKTQISIQKAHCILEGLALEVQTAYRQYL
jgi:hypothetical protein